MLVDRVDALLAIWDAICLPRASALLYPARVLLGNVLRDARALRAVLPDMPTELGNVRRPLNIALALLGERVAFDVAVMSSTSEGGVATYLFVLDLTSPGQDMLSAEIVRVLSYGRPSHRVAGGPLPRNGRDPLRDRLGWARMWVGVACAYVRPRKGASPRRATVSAPAVAAGADRNGQK